MKVSLFLYMHVYQQHTRKVRLSLFWIIFIKFAILVSGRDYGKREKVRTERN